MNVYADVPSGAVVVGVDDALHPVYVADARPVAGAVQSDLLASPARNLEFGRRRAVVPTTYRGTNLHVRLPPLSSDMSASLPRWLVLGLAGVALGGALGGPFAYGALSTYSSVPIPSPLVLAPVVGLLVYWWSTDITEGLELIAVTTVAAGIYMVVVLSIPAFVLDASAAGRAAVYQTAIFNTFTSLLLPLPIIVITVALASVLDTETKLLSGIERGRPGTRLVGATLALLVVSVLLTGAIGTNYASAVDQSRADVTVRGIDVVDDQVVVTVAVPNRLRTAMTVESVVVEFTLNGTDHVRATDVVRRDVAPGETVGFRVPVEREKLSATEYRQASSVRVEGIVRVSAFREYETDLVIEPYKP